MKSKIVCLRKYWPFFLIFISFLVICHDWPLYADDDVYRNAIKNYGTIWNWMEYYFTAWSGRIIPNLLLIGLLNLPEICFNIINSASITLLIIYFIADFIEIKSIRCKNVVALLLIFLILTWMDRDMLKGTMFWKSAAVSYIWGMTGALMAIYPFMQRFKENQKSLNTGCYALAVGGALYAANYEQSAVFMILMMAALILFGILKEQKVHIVDGMILITTIVVSLVLLAAPGNDVRFHAEVLGHMQNYDMYSLIDRLTWGVCYALANLKKYCTMPMLMICIYLLIVCHLKHKNWQIKIATYFVSVYYFIMLLSEMSHVFLNTKLVIPLFEFASVDYANCCSSDRGVLLFPYCIIDFTIKR